MFTYWNEAITIILLILFIKDKLEEKMKRKAMFNATADLTTYLCKVHLENYHKQMVVNINTQLDDLFKDLNK